MTVLITDTTLHYSFQGFFPGGIPIRETLSLAAELDEVGFFSLEVGDDTGFYLSSYFLGEDPWERLRALRQKVTKTPLGMTLHPQNRAADPKVSEERIDEFVKSAVKIGVSIFRVYDASNHVSKLATTIRTVRKWGAAVQGVVLYSASPPSTQVFGAMAAELEKLGADSACVLDAAGSLTPAAVSDLVRDIKAQIRIPLGLHSQSIKGIAPVTYYAAAAAGVDILDTAFAAFVPGRSQPATESMVAALKDTPHDSGLSVSKIDAIGEHFASLAEKYRPIFGRETASPEALSTFSRHLTEMKEDIRKLGLRSEEVIKLTVKSSSAPPPAAESPKEFSIELDGEVFNFKISPVAPKPAALEKPKESVDIARGSVFSPMPGVLLSINVKVGDHVSDGQLVATVEAMKMHYEVYAAWSGRVSAVLCSEGDVVEAESVLIVVEPDDQ